jgi:hypothetical protein
MLDSVERLQQQGVSASGAGNPTFKPSFEMPDTDFKRARELLSTAERVYCLGFGYGGANTDRLGLRYLRCTSMGTGAGLTDHEIANIRRSIDSKIAIADMNCMSFMRNRVEWD